MSTPVIALDAIPPYVRGASGRTYRITKGIPDVDKYLGQLHQIGAPATHEDYDVLLEARHVLAARTKENQ